MKLTMQLDTERPNRGWVVDKVNAGDRGYLKCSYIPEKNFELFYPLNVISFVDHIQGWCGMEDKYKRGEKTYFSHIGYNNEKITCKKARQIIERRQGENYQNFIAYYKDKPYEDFIQVEPAYEGSGLAEEMILFAVDHYRQRGMEFHLSNLRTEGRSEGLFQKIVKKHNLPTKHELWSNKKRYYFPLET